MEGEDFLLVAETDNKLVGYISAQKGRLHRIAHSAYIVVGILADYRGIGIGTEFLKDCMFGLKNHFISLTYNLSVPLP